MPKHAPRVAAYGEVDELNAVLGVARAWNEREPPGPARDRIDGLLGALQDELFVLGSTLATLPADYWEGMDRITSDHVEALEREIDAMNAELPPLEEFILPGGGPVGAALHHARTVCRRVERAITALYAAEAEADPLPVAYVNRLGDLLFVFARWAARVGGEEERYWQRGRPPGR